MALINKIDVALIHFLLFFKCDITDQVRRPELKKLLKLIISCSCSITIISFSRHVKDASQ